MTQSVWGPFEDGETIGTTGTEGTILRDECLPGEARATLEKKGDDHYAVTCGIYGWMVCTFFFSENDFHRGYMRIKAKLKEIVSMIPYEGEANEENMSVVTRMITEFCQQA